MEALEGDLVLTIGSLKCLAIRADNGLRPRPTFSTLLGLMFNIAQSHGGSGLVRSSERWLHNSTYLLSNCLARRPSNSSRLWTCCAMPLSARNAIMSAFSILFSVNSSPFFDEITQP